MEESGLTALLEGRVPPGVYRWTVPGGTRRSDVAAAAKGAGWLLFWLAGQAVTEKDEYLDLCAETFAFPDWFGRDWDALGDCLTDLTWQVHGAGHLVVYAGWQALAESDEDAFEVALDVFEEAIDLWRDSDTPMTVLLPGDGAAASRRPVLGG